MDLLVHGSGVGLGVGGVEDAGGCWRPWLLCLALVRRSIGMLDVELL